MTGTVWTFPWMAAGPLTLGLGLSIDRVSITVAGLVLFVGVLVLLYSLAYLRADEGRARFFATMAFFVSAMLVLVLAGTLLTLFIAWELVGAASYLLIGHRRHDAAAAGAAVKAFLTTRTADLALLAGVALTVVVTGEDRLDAPLRAGPFVPTIAALFLVGALGKSAQLPFSAWLPDAMRGPTPVSALLHSATMVAAGAYLLVRLFPLFEAAGLLPLVALVGIATSVFAALAAFAQTDLKRVLAYSTIAQLAEMITAVGLGAPLAALALLIAHAFYKGSLFLVAGELEHAAGTTAMSVASRYRLGALAHVAFVLSALALVGIPVSIAPSPRDSVLAAGLAAGVVPAVALLLVAVLTGAYVARAYRLTFRGRPSRRAAAPALLTLPALALALGVVLFGILTSPLLGDPFARWLSEIGPAPAMPLATIGGAGAGLAGMALGWRFTTLPVSLASSARGGFGLDRALVALADAGAGSFALLARVDARLFDRLPSAVAAGFVAIRGWSDALERRGFEAIATTVASGALPLFTVSARVDRRLVDRAFDRAAELLAQAAERGRRLQSGLLEHYLVAVGAWVLALVGFASLAAFGLLRR